jgi:hypothetical protein
MKKYLLLIGLLGVFDHSAFAVGRAPITILDSCLKKNADVTFVNIGYGRVRVDFFNRDKGGLLRKFNVDLKTLKPSDLCDQVGREVSYQRPERAQSEERRVATPEEEADELERLKAVLNLFPGTSLSFRHYEGARGDHISLNLSMRKSSSDLYMESVQINEDGVREVLDTLIDKYYKANLGSLQKATRTAVIIKSHPRMIETAARQVGKEESGKTVEDIQRMVGGAVSTAGSNHEPGTPDFNRLFLKELSYQYGHYGVENVKFEKMLREVAEKQLQLADMEKELDNKKKDLALMEERFAQMKQDIADMQEDLSKARSSSSEQ